MRPRKLTPRRPGTIALPALPYMNEARIRLGRKALWEFTGLVNALILAGTNLSPHAIQALADYCDKTWPPDEHETVYSPF